MNNLWSELKRRNVVRVAIAYAVVAWALVQAADILLPRFGAPEGMITGFFILLGLGFPVALIIAWAFELTPEGLKKTAEVDKSKSITHGTGQKINKIIAGGFILAVSFIIYDKIIATDEIITEAQAGVLSIAVLPFDDLSQAGDQEYFSDGMTEEILNALAKIPDLQVAARTSAFAYKGQNLDLRKVGKELGVEYILEGSVRRADNMVRITAQLIEVEGGFHIWSNTYDRELVNIFALQEELSLAIAGELKLTLNVDDTPVITATTQNTEAYDLYLQGLQHLRNRTSVPEGLPLLLKAVELDPDFGPAWANLSLSWDVLPIYLTDEEEEEYGGREFMAQKAIEAAKQAYQLAPNSPAALHAMAQASNDLTEAIEFGLRALEIDPSNTYVMEDVASYYFRGGLNEKAVEVSERLVALDPIPINILSYAMSLTRAGRYEEAIVQYNRGARMNPAFGPFVWFGMDTYLLTGEYGEMEAYFDIFEGHYSSIEIFKDYARKINEDFVENGRLTETSLALSYGDRANFIISITNDLNDEATLEEVFEEVERPGAGEFHDFAFIFNDPRFSPILESERFKSVVRNSGVLKFWKKFGYPTACKPLGADDFDCRVGE